MFGQKSIIVCALTPEKTLDASFVVHTGKVLRVANVISGVSFQTLKKTHHVSHVRLLVSEDDVYLKLLRFPKGTIITRDMVLEKIREIIPEDIADAFVDWKKVGVGNEELGVQVFAVKQSVLVPLLKSASVSGVTIDAVESPSLAMARLTSHILESFLLVYPPAKPQYLAAVSGGKVLEVVSADALHSLEDAKRAFVTYVKKMWGVTVTAIATDLPNPIIGLAAKQDFQGEDMDVLTVPSVGFAKQTRSLSVPLIIVGVALLVFVIAFFIIRFTGSKPITKTEIPHTVAVVSPTATPTEKPIQKSALVIEIQNGNGEVGLAGKWKAVLSKAGYTNITTGNADNYDYRTVIVQAKTASIAAMLVTDVSSPNAVATAAATFLDSSSSIDAIVIVGRNPAL